MPQGPKKKERRSWELERLKFCAVLDWTFNIRNVTVFTAKSELKAVDSARISINGHRKGDWKELVESEWRGKNNAFPNCIPTPFSPFNKSVTQDLFLI